MKLTDFITRDDKEKEDIMYSKLKRRGEKFYKKYSDKNPLIK